MENEIDKEFIIADPNAEVEIKQPIIWKTSEEKSKIVANAREITEEKEQNQIINFHPDKVQV